MKTTSHILIAFWWCLKRVSPLQWAGIVGIYAAGFCTLMGDMMNCPWLFILAGLLFIMGIILINFR